MFTKHTWNKQKLNSMHFEYTRNNFACRPHRAINLCFICSQCITHLSLFQDSWTHLSFECHYPDLIYIVVIFYVSGWWRDLQIDVRVIDITLIVRILQFGRIRNYVRFYSREVNDISHKIMSTFQNPMKPSAL